MGDVNPTNTVGIEGIGMARTTKIKLEQFVPPAIWQMEDSRPQQQSSNGYVVRIVPRKIQCFTDLKFKRSS